MILIKEKDYYSLKLKDDWSIDMHLRIVGGWSQDILYNDLNGRYISHYFNLIDNNVVDFTSSQFNKEIDYNDKIKKDRIEILQDDDTASRYKMLKMRLNNEFNR